MILSAEAIVRDWAPPQPERLVLTDLEAAFSLEPEIVIVGTGTALTLPQFDLMAACAERGVGLEIMDTPAACRTYNVLVHEQRSVVAALFIAD